MRGTAARSREDEEKLIRRAMAGDQQAFAMLYMRYYRRLCAYLRRFISDGELVQDIAQETFIRAQRVLCAGRYQESGRFFEWLRRIAYNYFIDQYRKARSRRWGTFSEMFEEEDRAKPLGSWDDTLLPDRRLIQKEQQRILRELLETLPPEQREVVIRRFFHGMSFRRIAEEMNANINTTQGRLRYALKRMRKALPPHLYAELLVALGKSSGRGGGWSPATEAESSSSSSSPSSSSSTSERVRVLRRRG